MYLLGYDIGSSSVKASLVDAVTGMCVASDFSPKKEMEIIAKKNGWAEQDPEQWWTNLQAATRSVLSQADIDGSEIKAIGISYQMHGLIVVDKNQNVLRPAIIWCDSRAVSYGEQAFNTLGKQFCLEHLLNSPGNFTASKLAWIKENEPEIFEKIDKIMLPGDYIAMRLTGEIRTTVSGLSEGIFWDFKNDCISKELLAHYGLDESIIAPIVPTFGIQGAVSNHAAQILGLTAGTPVTYRAGDQPNNALSLNVFNPGEIASTAGTSGVVYGLNGTGILNSWIKRNVAPEDISYASMNLLASQVEIGCDGVSIVPFGNGAERILQNKEVGASIHGLNYNRHDRYHLMRAAQEGIVFSFKYGMEIMESIGIDIHTIKAGHANMFLSPIFRDTLAGVTEATIELYDTDGSVGAAKGAGIGAGIYKSTEEAFSSLKKIQVIEPETRNIAAYKEAYARWKDIVENLIK